MTWQNQYSAVMFVFKCEVSPGYEMKSEYKNQVNMKAT